MSDFNKIERLLVSDVYSKKHSKPASGVWSLLGVIHLYLCCYLNFWYSSLKHTYSRNLEFGIKLLIILAELTCKSWGTIASSFYNYLFRYACKWSQNPSQSSCKNKNGRSILNIEFALSYRRPKIEKKEDFEDTGFIFSSFL